MCILRRWVGRGAAALALALVLSMVPAAAFATDGSVHCGQVLKKDTVLNNDLTNCPGDGLIIGANGVRVDLNGHEISGTEAGNAGSAGIRNRGHDGVVIKDDESFIHGFQTGILLKGVEHNRVIGLGAVDGSVSDPETSSSFGIGIALYNSHDNVLRGNNALGGTSNQCGAVKGAGIALFNSDHNDIEKNLGQLSDFGIALVGSKRNVLEENQAAPENSDGNSCFGIYVADSNRNVLRENIADNNHEGIFVAAGSRHTRIVGNLAEFNGDDGIDVNSAATTITRNTANTNSDLGIEAVAGVTDGGGNKANNNGDPRQCVNVKCN